MIAEKIQRMKPEEMAFVFDFDGTLTKKYVGDIEVPSVISILRSEGILNDEYAKEAYDLKNTYHPIEIDPSIPKEVKFEKMTEWWQKHIDLLIKHSLKKDDIKKAAYHPKLVIREGATELFAFAKQHNIPVIIFSASGIGTDSIHFFLEKHALTNGNIFIVSNKLEYTNEVVTSVTHQLIHALNKNEGTLKYFPEAQKALLARKSVLLFGDSPNDTEMVEDRNHELVIRIGLCSEKDPEKQNLVSSLFTEKFDLVIENDGSLEPIHSLLLQNKG